MAEDNNSNNDKQKNSIPKVPGGGKFKKPNPMGWLFIISVMLLIISSFGKLTPTDSIKYSEFERLVEQGYVRNVEIGTGSVTIEGELTDAGVQARKRENPNAANRFKTQYSPEILEGTKDLLAEKQVDYKFVADGFWVTFLIQVAPFLIIIALFYFIFARNMKSGAGGMLMNFGRSKARLMGDEQKKVTFKDVAGIDEAKDEVAETIEFLKNPKRFMKIGGRIPRGILLEGPPGCGKTLLAKSIAGEADVPFYSISGSDFVEMFVGVGASRVRDLFKQSKENAPCIIFLDEIDAIGKKRGPGVASGGHDEREQTLNAILVEMDGFESTDQVIVIAATNRVDVLDHALIRPGRFDRQIYVPFPDIKGRLEILKVHSKKIKMSQKVNLEVIARGTPMFSGAELEALINEAAIGATMANKNYVEQDDLEEARDKVRWGRAKRSRVIDKKEKELTAYHEAGHTLIQSVLEDADPLHKVSIIPRGPYGGATFSLPEKERMTFSSKYCYAFIKVCFGGRIAEDIFFDDVTSGAQNDIKQATMLVQHMVTDWGMSDKIGMVNFSGDNDQKMMFGGRKLDCSEKTSEVIDAEVKRIIDSCYNEAYKLIEENKDKVEGIAKALLKYETLDADEVKTILDGGELTRPTVSDLVEAEKNKSSELRTLFDDDDEESLKEDDFYDTDIEDEEEEDDDLYWDLDEDEEFEDNDDDKDSHDSSDNEDRKD
ncbi:ATP-dependent zinc metalloprotease FtsH [Sedimentisphaera salicampi]|uniref:ATP-dependent zinc metalloprotease FtsH n=1 Tax=Sedimentisphaera salicampi TaxID=1941349 RepID=A0A1W6LMK5_9BACT|nr:ATP-dependent zinc metalloprotease FtsH [Sedimentisphaera salicampi]ARN57007.1 ATP-dependent zinc metalloprotease FtsH [Sedimentisphaera salicampi]